MALVNKWYLRTVADNAGKACWIDYKTTTSVLITPDNKDFFYICRGHLKDRTFCTPATPVEDADAVAKKREDDLQKEIEAIKKEYAEKQAKKKNDKSKDAGGEDKKKQEEEDKAEEKSKEDKIVAATEKSKAEPSSKEDLPRIYSLHRNFFQMRLDRIRNAEIARRNRDRLKDPTTFPSVPKGDLS